MDPLPENKANLVFADELKLDYTKKAELDALQQLYNTVTLLIQRYKPQHVVIESTYFGLNYKTCVVLENYRGVAQLACLMNGIAREQMYEYGASTVRSRVLGNGKLKKNEVADALSTYFGQQLHTKGFDKSDAVCLALCHAKVVVKEPAPKPKPKRKPKTPK